jgi:hypothetical protein
MEYEVFAKNLNLPADFAPPEELVYADLRARVLSRADLDDDVRGINASLGLIRRTRGGTWPTEPVTNDYNFADLVWHEVEFRERYSFSYAVYDSTDRYLGCAYLYPMGRRTMLTEDRLEYDVDVSWWVTTEAYGQGYYEKLHEALEHWVTEVYPFRRPYYSNAEIPGHS